jgi:hypothetical protein
MLKSLCVLSAVALLGACSHQQPKKVSKPHHVSKSFLDVINTKKPGKPETDERFPASTKTIPGLKDFMVALKANPDFLKAPVGVEVVKEDSGVYEGESYKEQDKTVYLKQNSHGYFVFEYDDRDEESPIDFILYERQRIEGVEEDIVEQGSIQSFKKLSPTKYVMTFKFPESSGFKGTCEMQLDLLKSSELQEILCKDSSGAIVSQTKILSVKPINIKDYSSSLKSIKLEVRPNALDCSSATDDQECSDNVKDDQEKDWSYLLK